MTKSGRGGQGAEFRSAHVEQFLEHITRDLETELAKISREKQETIKTIRHEAFQRAIKFHRRMSVEARSRLNQDYERKLSRARNEFRRRRWQLFGELQQEARVLLEHELFSWWQEPEHQYAWCLHWLKGAQDAGAESPVYIVAGRGALETVVAGLGPGGAKLGLDCNVKIDDEASAGLVIYWGDRVLDGTLEAQTGVLLEDIVKTLAGWIHEGDSDQAVEQ